MPGNAAHKRVVVGGVDGEAVTGAAAIDGDRMPTREGGGGARWGRRGERAGGMMKGIGEEWGQGGRDPLWLPTAGRSQQGGGGLSTRTGGGG